MSYLLRDLILKIFITENFKHVKLNNKMSLCAHTVQLLSYVLSPTPDYLETDPRYYFIHNYFTTFPFEIIPFFKHDDYHI